MNCQKNIPNKKFKLVICVGDESGIGPEIILKALSSEEIPQNIDISIVGSKINLQKTFTNLKNLKVTNIIDPNQHQIHDLKIPFDFPLFT